MNRYWNKRLHTWSNSVRKRMGKPKIAYVDETEALEALLAARSEKIAHASLSAATIPRLAVVAMARNEADRAHEVMRHFTALFDHAVVIDHLSEDGTGKIVAGYDGNDGCKVDVLRSNEPGYLQSEYMTEAATALIASGKFDWVFFLDFDEFLPFQSADRLHQALVHMANTDAIGLNWVNCALPGGWTPTLNGATAMIRETFSPFVKVAINARRLKGRDVAIEQGNHAVKLDDHTTSFAGVPAFGVYHLPKMSPDKLAAKLEQGVRAYDDLGDRAEEQGNHWREMQDKLQELASDEAVLQKVTLHYGEAIEKVLDSEDDVVREIRITFAQAPSCEPVDAVDAREITVDTLQSVLGDLLSTTTADADATIPAVYQTLPPRDLHLSDAGRAERVERAILAGAQPLGTVMPTSWAGHEPFLYSVMEALRPRRYVELGSHHGHSFFTACQHYKVNGNYGEGVAIDLWEGDHQAGFYGERVFDHFKDILDAQYKDCGRFIRSYFSEAVTAFEPGSIELLHIDGLHTYDAVKEDFETWFPKLAANGVILFHDTSEFQTDFGVWQFFDEVQEKAAASFNFVHGHGLGVLAFGTREQNPAIELLEHFQTRASLIEHHYAVLGASIHAAKRFETMSARLNDKRK